MELVSHIKMRHMSSTWCDFGLQFRTIPLSSEMNSRFSALHLPWIDLTTVVERTTITLGWPRDRIWVHYVPSIEITTVFEVLRSASIASRLLVKLNLSITFSWNILSIFVLDELFFVCFVCLPERSRKRARRAESPSEARDVAHKVRSRIISYSSLLIWPRRLVPGLLLL